MLPQHADEHEDGGDENEGEGDLRDGAGGEGFDVDVGAGAGVALFVPAREGGEEEEGYEGEDYGDDAVRKFGLGDIMGCGVRVRVWAYMRYGNTTSFLNVSATQIRFSGS